jgi:UPF0271 protein
MKKLKINSDVGEGVEWEAELMPFLDSCSIACGGHFGDVFTMTKSVELAIANDVKIGAHPSYPDKKGFGRNKINITNNELKDSIVSQIQGLVDVMNEHNTDLSHVKAHGSLYNTCAVDYELSLLFVEAVKKFQVDSIYAPYKSVLAEVAKSFDLKVVNEVFLDRNYNDDYSLVPRNQSNSMILEPNNMLDRYLNVITRSSLKTVSNSEIFIEADTFCIHGDTLNSNKILKEIYRMYKKKYESL